MRHPGKPGSTHNVQKLSAESTTKQQASSLHNLPPKGRAQKRSQQTRSRGRRGGTAPRGRAREGLRNLSGPSMLVAILVLGTKLKNRERAILVERIGNYDSQKSKSNTQIHQVNARCVLFEGICSKE